MVISCWVLALFVRVFDALFPVHNQGHRNFSKSRLQFNPKPPFFRLFFWGGVPSGNFPPPCLMAVKKFPVVVLQVTLFPTYHPHEVVPPVKSLPPRLYRSSCPPSPAPQVGPRACTGQVGQDQLHEGGGGGTKILRTGYFSH